MSDNTTILIPTMDRPEYIIRVLQYYKKLKFTGAILIGDSSSTENSTQIRDWISDNASQLNLKYYHCPKSEYCHDGMVMKHLTEQMTTKYGIFSGDDDFIVPSAIIDCAALLDKKHEYSSAAGHRAAFHLDQPGHIGKIIKVEHVPEPDLSSESPAVRWTNYMNLTISNQYHLQRHEVLIAAYYHCDAAKTRYIGPELMPCSISTICGKTAYLNKISCYFQVNKAQIFSWANRSIFDLIMSSEWSESVNTLKNAVLDQFVKAGVSRDMAEQLFEREFWDHIRRRLNWQFKERYSGDSRVKQLAKRIPGLLEIIRRRERCCFSRENDFGEQRNFSLKTLLDKRNPNHADFINITNALCNTL